VEVQAGFGSPILTLDGLHFGWDLDSTLQVLGHPNVGVLKSIPKALRRQFAAEASNLMSRVVANPQAEGEYARFWEERPATSSSLTS
jgi:hypothetical protein